MKTSRSWNIQYACNLLMGNEDSLFDLNDLIKDLASIHKLETELNAWKGQAGKLAYALYEFEEHTGAGNALYEYEAFKKEREE